MGKVEGREAETQKHWLQRCVQGLLTPTGNGGEGSAKLTLENATDGVCVHVCAHIYVCVFMCGGQWWVSCVFFNHSLPCF